MTESLSYERKTIFTFAGLLHDKVLQVFSYQSCFKFQSLMYKYQWLLNIELGFGNIVSVGCLNWSLTLYVQA